MRLTLISHRRASEVGQKTLDMERPADKRPSLYSKWQGREGRFYTVQGKGGLIREILIPHHLVARLEATRL